MNQERKGNREKKGINFGITNKKAPRCGELSMIKYSGIYEVIRVSNNNKPEQFP